MLKIICRLVPLVVSAGILTAGCDGNGSQAEPPEGWEQSDDQWWRTNVDRGYVFRDVSTLESMGVAVEAGDEVRGTAINQQQADLINGVKQELLLMYRNQPEVLDSLFEVRAAHIIVEREPEPGLSDEELLQDYSQRAYAQISDYFRQPNTRLQLGSDVPVAFPDSLRHLSGSIETQVYMDEAGVPAAVELLEGIHPVLNGIAMNAATRMRWNPAYLEGEPIPSWARFQVTFRAP